MPPPSNRRFVRDKGSRNTAKVNVRFDYRPFDHTEALHRAFTKFRERVAVTGARGGKTTCGIADVRHQAIAQPGYHPDDIDAEEPYTIFVGAPDFPRVNRIILPAFLRAIPRALIAKPYHHQDHLIKLYGKKGITDVYFLSAAFPDRWQGVKAYGIWLDEFALMKEAMYDEARTRLFDRAGWLLLTGTPAGPNWAYKRIYEPWLEDKKRIERGHKSKRPELYFSTWHTAQNPHLPKGARDQLARYRATMPEKYYRRTYEASWDVFEGQVYEEWQQAVHVVAEEDHTFVLPGGKRVGSGKTVIRLAKTVCGVDWGSTADHKGVIVVLGKSIQGVWYLLEEVVAPNAATGLGSLLVRGRDHREDSWIRRALAIRAKWRVDVFYCDPARPENIRMFRDENLPAEAALNSVDPGIQCVGRNMHVLETPENGEPDTRFKVLDSCPVSIGEFGNYHWEDGRAREVPAKVLDDTMDAIRYGMYTSEERGESDSSRKDNFDFA